jgi:hypothetical protein
MQQQEQPAPSFEQDMANSAAIVTWIVASLASLTSVFTRVNFGRDYFRWQILLGLLALWFYSAETSPHDAMPCLVFTGVFFLMLFHHRVRYFVSHAGRDQKRFYNGQSRLCVEDPTLPEDTAKLYADPFVISCAAILVWDLWSPSLGKFLLVSAACGVIEHLMCLRYLREQVQDIRDAEIDQEIVSREYDRRFGS